MSVADLSDGLKARMIALYSSNQVLANVLDAGNAAPARSSWLKEMHWLVETDSGSCARVCVFRPRDSCARASSWIRRARNGMRTSSSPPALRRARRSRRSRYRELRIRASRSRLFRAKALGVAPRRGPLCSSPQNATTTFPGHASPAHKTPGARQPWVPSTARTPSSSPEERSPSPHRARCGVPSHSHDLSISIWI
jgi:hypothetical protein